MGLSTESSAKPDGKKPVDSAVNMIPFIDLLVCSIAFLIITAVWNQLERLDVVQREGPVESRSDDAPDPKLFVQMGEAGLVIVDEVGTRRTVPDRGALGRVLAEIRPTVPPRTRVVVTPDDGQRYEDIVAVMDAAIAARFVDLAVSPP
jgi:biopolymer transport protein ExbD